MIVGKIEEDNTFSAQDVRPATSKFKASVSNGNRG